MTHLHPNILGALSALADLADQHRWLADMLEPGRTSRRPTAVITPAAKAARSRQYAAEQRDLAATLRAGLKPAGTGRAPANLSVIDAQLLALAAVVEGAWWCTDHLHRFEVERYSGVDGTDAARFTAAAAYLRDALPLVGAALAGQVGDSLTEAARTVARATDQHPVRSRFDWGPCPACGMDTLVVQTTSVFETALILCSAPGCRCWGLNCGCRRPERLRVEGLKHVWEDQEFGQLAETIRRAA